MDLGAIYGVLGDLPSTFRRAGAPYTQFVDSTATSLVELTAGADAVWTQVLVFGNALDGWLDTWGLLWGIPRTDNEGNGPYAVRIQETVLAVVGTMPGMQIWIDLFAPGGSVAENASGLGYKITLPPSMTSAQIDAFLLTLNRVRPIGVPFTVEQLSAGTFLGTIAFLGSGSRVPGDYLSANPTSVGLPIGANTLSARPLLPSLLFVDPTINPSFAPTS